MAKKKVKKAKKRRFLVRLNCEYNLERQAAAGDPLAARALAGRQRRALRVRSLLWVRDGAQLTTLGLRSGYGYGDGYGEEVSA